MTPLPKLNEIQAQWTALDHKSSSTDIERVAHLMKANLPASHISRVASGHYQVLYKHSPVSHNNCTFADAKLVAARFEVQTEVLWDGVTGQYVVCEDLN